MTDALRLPRTPYLFFALFAFLILAPLFPEKILQTQNNDLANHVRHIFEYKQAIHEGQFPPLVAPLLNQQHRIPLFQFYSGTGYTLPALLSFITQNEYLSLKLSIFLLSFLTAASLFVVLKKIVNNQAAAFIGVMCFQLFNFSMIDLYVRGGFIEWESMQLAGLCFASLIALCQHIASPSRRWRTLLAIMTLSVFVPCHPAQTIYTGGMIALLVLAYIFTYIERHLWLTLFLHLITVLFLSLLLTAWFWLPVLQNYNLLKIKNHFVYLSSGIEIQILLWPWYRITHATPEWAPQLGSIISVSIVFLFFMLKKLHAFTKISLGLLVLLLGFAVLPSYLHLRAIDLFLSPLQWSYRLLIPCALLATIITAFAQLQLYTLCKNEFRIKLVFYASFSVVFISFLPYLLLKVFTGHYPYSLDVITMPKSYVFTANAYAFRGTDFQALGWVKGQTMNSTIHMPTDGPSFQAVLLLSSPRLRPQSLSLAVSPLSGMDTWNKPKINFNFYHAHPIVLDQKFLPAQDSQWIHLPDTFQIIQSPHLHHSLIALATTGSPGLYQLPFCYFPSLNINVNGKPTSMASHDKYLIVVPLNKGKNIIELMTLPSRMAMQLFWCAVIIILIPLISGVVKNEFRFFKK